MVQGLGATPTPLRQKFPAKPVNKRMLHMILNNPYYKGIVTYGGVQYSGRHKPIIDEATWDKVQEILRSHVNGEHSRIHEHYLKSTVYCGKCGARLIIQNTKSRSGNWYAYFVCSAKHNKRNNCRQKALLIDDVAEKIEELYERISFTSEFKDLVQQWLNTQVEKLAEEAKGELNRLKQQKDKLEREQHKLLQAHYADALPLHLLKEEQERIGKSLKNITSQIEAYQSEHTKISKNLGYAFELLDDCGRAYKLADDFARRCINQAIFKKIRVHDDLTLEADYAEPFDTILNPEIFVIKGEFEKNVQKVIGEQPESTARATSMDFLHTVKEQTNSKLTNFFTAGLSKDFLVPEAGLEPARSFPH